LIGSLLCVAAACSILTGTLLAYFRPDVPANVSQRALTFAERVAYQRAIEEVYWRHRIWPKERPDPKLSLDAVMSQAQLEKKVGNYLRDSQLLADQWQRSITAEQLQAEMERMASQTRQPEVLRELFAALDNDPFTIAECLARPALAEHLVTNLYAYDQRFHGELRQRAQADLQAHPNVEQMKQTSGNYSEIEFVRSDSGEEQHNHGIEHGLKLNSREWDENVQKLAAMSTGGRYCALPAASPYDLNHDSKPDYVLYKASTRQTAVWYMHNNVPAGGASTGTLPAGWTLVGAADFNFDGNNDYVLFNSSTRHTAIWYLSGVRFIRGASGPTLPAGWALIETGDFNRDRKPDYVLYNASTRQTAVWYLDNNAYMGGGYGPTIPAPWSLVGVADFNRDGKSDYLLFNPSTHYSVIWYLSGTARIGSAFGPTIATGYNLTLISTAMASRIMCFTIPTRGGQPCGT
jgi:hypothetical protein